ARGGLVDAGRGDAGFAARSGTDPGRPPSAGPDVRRAGVCGADARGSGPTASGTRSAARSAEGRVPVEDEVEAEGSGLEVDGGEGVAALAEMALALLGVREPQPGPQS